MLHDAALKGYREIAELLIAGGARVNARNGSGATPLHDAALGGYREMVELLIAKGADPEARDSETGATPCIWRPRGDAPKRSTRCLRRALTPSLPTKRASVPCRRPWKTSHGSRGTAAPA